MKILAIGDPHGKIPKKLPKDIDLTLVTGDIGKADLARKRAFENKAREDKGLPELKETPEEMKKIHYEINDSTVRLLKKLGRVSPVFTIQGNVGIPSRSHVRKAEEKYGLKLPCTREVIVAMPGINIVKNRLRVLQGLRVGFLEYFIDTSWVREFHPANYREKLKDAKEDTEKARRIGFSLRGQL